MSEDQFTPEEYNRLIRRLNKLPSDPDAERYNNFDKRPKNVLATLNEIERLRAELAELRVILERKPRTCTWKELGESGEWGGRMRCHLVL